MKFSLFSKVPFEVSDPIALIECYCFQNDFYGNYDLKKSKSKEIENVRFIGARIPNESLRKCKKIVEKPENVRLFEDKQLDEFLRLDREARNKWVIEINDKIIKELLKIKGIGLSKATKVLHTLYPEIIPMIDNALQDEYKETNPKWIEEQSDQILIDYYDNLKKGDNWQNLNIIFKKISNNLPALTKVRVFDIIWWSYLKSKKLKINWYTIK
jgi:hypothetical protein